MNVSCPECNSVFRVDPAKVPPAGVRARCSVCGGVIPIGLTGVIDQEFAATLDRRGRPAEASAAAGSAMPRESSPVALAEAERPPVVTREPDRHPPAPREAERPAAPAPEPARMVPAAPPPPPPMAAPRPEPWPSPSDLPVSAAPVAAAPPPAAPAAAPPAAPASPPPRAPWAPAPLGSPPGAGAAAAAPSSRAAEPPPAPAPSARAASVPASPTGRPAAAPPAAAPPAAAPAAAPPAPQAPLAFVPRPTPAVSSAHRPASRPPINPFLANDPNQKAKRLARALVSDILAYFPQKHREALRTGTIKEQFREEIKKSYEEYSDQMGRDFADSTTHFQDALNEVLAGGQKVF